MTQHWLVVVPVWGDRYIDIFLAAALPALKRAIEPLGSRATLVLYADREKRLLEALTNMRTEVRAVPGPDRSFYSMAQAHREAMHRAQPGERIALLTADMVVSANSLPNCETHFVARGKRIVCCAGMRVDDAQPPPQTVNGPELLRWGWEHRHRMTRECTWPDGTSYDLWRMYFEKDGEVACRLCLPHPLALIRDHRNINFGPTVDVNVAGNFAIAETHVVTDPNDVAVIEMSPHDKEFLITDSMAVRHRKGMCPSIPPFIKLTNKRHRWYFGHKIVIAGTGGDCGDQPVLERLLNGT